MKFGRTVQERAEVRIGVLFRSESEMLGNAVKKGPACARVRVRSVWCVVGRTEVYLSRLSEHRRLESRASFLRGVEVRRDRESWTVAF